jgi:multiple sugar transport system permease protein
MRNRLEHWRTQWECNGGIRRIRPLRFSLKLTGWLILVAGAVLSLLPFLWMLSNSLKRLEDVFIFPVQWLPSPVIWANYPGALSQYAFDRYFLNSFLVSISVTVLQLLICALAGYSLAKFSYRLRDLIFIAVLSTMMLPMEVVMVPTFLIVKKLNWLNSYEGLIFPMAVEAFSIFLMRQFFLSFPSELIDAARIDGCSELGIFWRIVLPNSKPALATVGLFAFRESWDMFIWPLIIISQDHLRTIPLGIAKFEEAYFTSYPHVMAVATIGILPAILLFIFMQRAYVRGITMTGLKY